MPPALHRRARRERQGRARGEPGALRMRRARQRACCRDEDPGTVALQLGGPRGAALGGSSSGAAAARVRDESAQTGLQRRARGCESYGLLESRRGGHRKRAVDIKLVHRSDHRGSWGGGHPKRRAEHENLLCLFYDINLELRAIPKTSFNSPRLLPVELTDLRTKADRTHRKNGGAKGARAASPRCSRRTRRMHAPPICCGGCW